MPKYRIADPDGKNWEIEGPEGATQEEIVNAITSTDTYKTYQSRKQNKALPNQEPTAGEVLKAATRNTGTALRGVWESMKNADLPPEARVEKRKEFARKLAEESKNAPQIDTSKLPIEKKLLGMVPGAAGVLGAGALGTLVGGPAAGVALGGSMLGLLTGGGSEVERANLEAQGVDPKVAGKVSNLEGIVKPAGQVAAATMGPLAGAVGVPAVSAGIEARKNALMQDQIAGPRTPEFPIAPFQSNGDDYLLDSLMGAAGGAMGRTSPQVPVPKAPPPALQGPRGPAPTPPPFQPRPGPSTPPTTPPSAPGGGRAPAVTPKPGQSVRGAIQENLATKLSEPVKTRPNLDIYIKAMDEAPKTTTTAGRVVTTSKAPPKSPTVDNPTAVRNVPSLVLPPASPNPFVPPTATPSTPERAALFDNIAKGASDSVDSPPDLSPKTFGTVALPKSLQAGFEVWWKENYPEGGNKQQAMLDYAENVVGKPASVEQEAARDANITQQAGDQIGIDEPPSASPPNYGPGYEDSLGAPESRFAPAEGKAPLRTLDKTATTPEVRQAIAAREPIETLPPNRRVQEGAGVSRQQVADQQALVKKLTYAGYREVKPGVWVHGDAPKKKVKDDPNWGKSRLDRKPVTPDDVESGNAYARDIYSIPNDVEKMDRVWGQNSDGLFVPWVKNTKLTPAKINPEATFIIADYDVDEGENNPYGIYGVLHREVGWIGLPRQDIPVFWEDFKNKLGPQFLSNGYDALSFRGVDGEPRLVVFNPSLITYIPVTTAKTITGEKVAEHVKQMRDVLWMRRDKNYFEETKSLATLGVRIKRGMSIVELAEFSTENAPSPGLRSLSSQILGALQQYEKAGLMNKVKINFSPFSNASGTFHISKPEHSKKAGLEINLNLPDGLTYRTVIHELIHAVTIPVLSALRANENVRNPEDSPELQEMGQRYYDLRKKMGEFYSFLQQMLATVPMVEGDDGHNKKLLKLLYNKSAWTENIHEVLAYALTEPEFQKILHDIPMKTGNGLWNTTEAVRGFHGISEDMNTLFFEAVKLFNEFAQQPIWFLPKLPQLLRSSPDAFYEAKQEIRGPPDFDKAVLTALDDHGQNMVMSGNMDLPYVTGRVKLDAVTASNGFPLVPVSSGADVFAFAQGQIPQTPMADAPAYFMGVPDQVFSTWQTNKPGVQTGGMHWYLVDNTDHPQVIGAMRRLMPDSFLDREEAILLIRRKIDTPTAIKPFLEEDRLRARISMLPKQIASTPEMKAKLKNVEAWLDLPIEDALAIWRQSPTKDIPKSYEFWGQLVSGAETAAVLTNHPFIRWARGRISADIAEQAQMSKQIIQPMGEVYLSLSDKERIDISNIMIQGDRSEMDYDENALRQMGMNDKQIQYFNLVRDADNYLFDLWNEKRAHLGFPPIPFRKGHIPSIFEGDYHALVKVDGEIIGFVGANNNMVGLPSSFDNRKREIKRQFPAAEFTNLPKKSLDGAPLNGNLFDVYMELTKALGPNDPNIQNLQNVLQEFAKFDENRYLGFHVHEMAKKGIWGASGDKPWLTEKENADDLFNALVRYFQEGTAHHNMLEFMQEMDKLFLDPEANEKAPHTLRYLRDLYTHVLRHNPVVQGEGTKLAKILKALGGAGDKTLESALSASDVVGLGIGPSALHKGSASVRWAFATWAMGLGNLSFSFLQLMQVPLFAPQMTMMLRKELGMDFTSGRLDAAKAATGLAKYILHHVSNGRTDNLFGPLSKDKETNLALTYAEDNNLINFTDIERALEHVVDPVSSKADRFLNFNQRYAEALTRPLVFLWFFHLNRSAGLPMKEALETARHRTQFVMVPYDLRDRPMAYASLGTLGMAMGQLKTFMHSSTSQAWYYTKQTKQGTFKPFLYGTAMAMFFQGQMGLIGMQDVDNIVRAMNQQLFNSNEGLKEIMYREAPKWFSKGYMTEWTGVDFYSRLRSPGAIQWPLQNSFIPPAYNWFYDQMENLFKNIGPAANALVGEQLGYSTKLKGDWETLKETRQFQQGILTFTPPPFKPAFEEVFGNKVYKKNAAPLEGYTRDDFDRTLRYMNMRSAKESDWMEKNRDRVGDKYFTSLSLQEVKTKLIEAYRTGSQSDSYVSSLEDAFFEKGGSMADFKALIKTIPPQTVDDDFFGKPSKRGALRQGILQDIDEKRKGQ